MLVTIYINRQKYSMYICIYTVSVCNVGPCIPVAHSATKVWACFRSMGLFSLLTGSWDRKWSMKSRGVTEARSHFSLFKTSSSICWAEENRDGGQRNRFKCDPNTHMRPKTHTGMDVFYLLVWILGVKGGARGILHSELHDNAQGLKANKTYKHTNWIKREVREDSLV